MAKAPEQDNSPLAVITGGSSGIGYELAAQFASNGFDLLIAAEDEGISQAEEDLQALGTNVQSLQCDLSTSEGVEALCRCITEINRPVSAVAINAGVGVGGKFIETDLQKEISMINLNVVGSVHLTKRIVQYMIKRGEGGRILFTSSIAATAPGPYEAVYSGTKAFLFVFAEALREELKEFGITVTALLPGPTDTNFFKRAGMENTKIGVGKKDDPTDVAKQGFEALMAGKDHVIAGSTKTRLENMANDLLPETVKAKIHGQMAKPGSGND